MTIATIYVPTTYTISGTGPYTFDWDVLNEASIIVTIDNILIDSSQYTVSLTGNSPIYNGGSITFNLAPSGTDLVISRDTLRDQQVDYLPYSPFPADTTEFTIDKLTMITQELPFISGGGGGIPPTENSFFEIFIKHLTDEPSNGSYRMQFRDLFGSPVFYLEPTNTTGDRSIILVTSNGTVQHQFDFSRDGFLALPALQIFTAGIATEAARFDLIDDGGQTVITFEPVSVDKTHHYRFTTDSSTGAEVYAGFKPNGSGYGSNPINTNDFVTLDYFNNNTPGASGVVDLTNQTNAEIFRIDYDELALQNVVTMKPVDPEKNTAYNFYTDTSAGNEIVIVFKSDGRIGIPAPASAAEDALRLGEANSLYVGVNDWENKIASIRYQNATPIGTQRGGTAVNNSTGNWTVTLSTPLSNISNARIQITPIDGVVAHYTCGYSVASTTTIDVTLRNASSLALADGEFCIDVWDNG